MEATGTAEQVERPTEADDSRADAGVVDWGGVATWLLAAALVIYLALENGGYDPIPRDQIGVAVWWALLLGVAVEALPVPGRTRAALAALGLLLGFAFWTALSMGWTESSERTANEMARAAAYLGVFALGISLATRRRAGARQLVHGVTAGLSLICAVAVLSRLHMAWFPSNELGKVLPGIEIERRLGYPLGYSSAVGAMAGMTLPLLLAATASARTIAFQALAAAAIPLAGLTLYLATSGMGVAATAAATSAFLLLSPARLPKLLTLAAGTGGGVVLASAVAGRDALARGLPSAAAEHQGTEVIWIALAVCAGVGLAQFAISLAVRHGRHPGLLPISRREALIAVVAVLVVAAPAAVAAGAPRGVSHAWKEFKSRGSGGSGGSSDTAFNFHGSGRYQFWEAAIEESEGSPWKGTGPGTFEFWWARHGSYSGFVRNAHSLYLESLGELGIPGLVLIAGFVLAVLGIGSVRALRAPPERRLTLAAATAGSTGFAMAAALDWVWQLAALAVAFMLLAAVAVSGYSVPEPRRNRRRRKRRRKRRNRSRLERAAVAAVAIAALIAIWHPLRGATALQQSQIDAGHGDLGAALGAAHDATDAQPYAASAHLQEALVLEKLDRLAAAEAAARTATAKEEANWRNWVILARIEAERGRIDASLRDFRRAHSLNPTYAFLKI